MGLCVSKKSEIIHIARDSSHIPSSNGSEDYRINSEEVARNTRFPEVKAETQDFGITNETFEYQEVDQNQSKNGNVANLSNDANASDDKESHRNSSNEADSDEERVNEKQENDHTDVKSRESSDVSDESSGDNDRPCDPNQYLKSAEENDQNVVTTNDNIEDRNDTEKDEEENEELEDQIGRTFDDCEEEEEEEEEEEIVEFEETNDEEKDEEHGSIDENEEFSEEEDDIENVLEQLGDTGIKRKILHGKIDIDVPSHLRLVRIFTSSTFTDTFVERNTLMERVYPKLKEYCQSLGYDFQVVDMRWGVRDEATNDHMTSELCMRELRACQKMSTGPNFITFLGQKYGYRPFPAKIEALEFEQMLTAIDNQKDKLLLLRWFVKDENCVPPAYLLQSIRTLLPSYNNDQSSEEERQEALQEWWDTFERLQIVLRKASSRVLDEEAARRKYFISVTEDEISRGLLSADNAGKHCFWFKRTITDINDNITMKKARLFIDKVQDDVDVEAIELLDNLKETRMLQTLPENNIREYNISWVGETGISTSESKEHNEYIDQLCDDFYDRLSNMIDIGIKDRTAEDFDDSLIQEISQHITTCKEKTKIFVGHENVLETIGDYIDGSSSRPLVVYGQSGCGKTSLMAQSARLVTEKYDDIGVILRFLGTTSESSTISKTLRSICAQLVRINGKGPMGIPDQFKKISEFFAEQISEMSRKVVIFLDSLDQLSPEDGAYNMQWLPRDLPKNVRIVLSTLPGEEYQVFPKLKARIPGGEEVYVEVPKMPEDTANHLLDAWLQDASRNLTGAQKQVVIDAFSKTPLPLFLKLSFDEAVRWKSYTLGSETRLEVSIKVAINTLFDRVERIHGKLLVSRALGYITAAKNGLSDAEMDDLLSLDDDVLNDVYQYWTPPVRRIPPLLWVRARSDLDSYIVYRGSEGVLVNQWYHRQFIETAQERYVTADVIHILHQNLSDYFLGTWSNGRKKPFTSKSGESNEKNRIVPSQPNIYSKEESSKSIYNLRKLSELPRHLIRSKNIELLKTKVLFNFDFLLSKLIGINFLSLISDFDEALQVYPDEKDIALLGECIDMSARAIFQDPYQLGAQLVARLSDDPHENIISLLDQVKRANIPCLYPSITCFDKPGGPLKHSLAGHTGQISTACLTKDGSRAISSSEDYTLKIWDMKTGDLMKSIDIDDSFENIALYCNETCLAMCGYCGLRCIDLNTEEDLFNDEDIKGRHAGSLAKSSNDNHIAHIGEERVTLFQVSGKILVKQRTEEFKTIKNEKGYSDFITGGGNYFAFVRGDKSKLFLRKFDDPEYSSTLLPPYPIMRATFSPTGDKVIALTTESIVQDAQKQIWLVVWDSTTCEVVHKCLSKYNHNMVNADFLTVIQIPSGLDLVWPDGYKILFWNISTEEERVALESGYQGSSYKEAQCSNGRHLLITPSNYNMHALQVYDLEALEYHEGGTQHMSEIEKSMGYVGKGDRELALAKDNSIIGISIPPMSPHLTVWDIQCHTRMRRVVFPSCYPHAVYCVGEEMAMVFDYNSRKVFMINHVTGNIVSTIDGYTSDTPPAAYLRTWEHIGDLKLLLLSRNKKMLDLWDMKTGKLVRNITVDWEQNIVNFVVSEDKSVIAFAMQDYNRELTETPVLFYHMNTEKYATYIEKGNHLDLRPEVQQLSRDGKLMFTVPQSTSRIYVIDTETGQKIRTLTYKGKRDGEKIAGSTIWCIAASKVPSSPFIVACCTCNIVQKRDQSNVYRIVAWNYETATVLAWINCGYLNKMTLSDDGYRLFTTSHAVEKQASSAQLWDLSEVLTGKILLMGSFLPETDLRFSYLTPDGQHICIGLANISDLVFLRPCGSKKIVKKTKDHVPDIHIAPNLPKYEE